MDLDAPDYDNLAFDTVDGLIEFLEVFDNVSVDYDGDEIVLVYRDYLYLPPALINKLASFGYIVSEAASTLAVFRRIDDMDIQIPD